MTTVTFLDAEHGPRAAAGAVRGDRVLLDPAALEALTGWNRKPEGLCRGEICVPVRDEELDTAEGIDARRLAEALRCPAVVDAAEGVVAFGVPAVERRGPIEAGLAPDFTLPQLDGGVFTFSSLGRRKKLLLAWSSW